MENNIKIVRLRNGEDIIGSLANVCNGNMDIIEPMSVAVEEGPHAKLIMSHWLPVQLIKKNEITLKEQDILTVFEPNDDFCEYYLHTVERIKDLLKAKNIADKMTDDEIEEVMDALEDSKGHSLH